MDLIRILNQINNSCQISCIPEKTVKLSIQAAVNKLQPSTIDLDIQQQIDKYQIEPKHKATHFIINTILMIQHYWGNGADGITVASYGWYLLIRLKLLMNFKSAPAFSLSKSLKKTITEMAPHNPAVPGPIYDVAGLGQREPSLSHSIGKGKRTEINHRVEHTPSPMHYDPQKLPAATHKTIPRSSFIDIPNLNPDPACYITDEKHTTRKVLAYTLSSRYPSIIDQNNTNPGPSDYQSANPLPILSRSKNAKQNSFGTGSRFKYNTVQNPGAGHYEVNPSSTLEHKPSIGKADRHPVIESTPGPSDYHKASFVEQSLKDKVGKSLGSRFGSTFFNDRTTINAFHKYHENPEGLFADSKASPKYSIGRQKREFIKPNPNPSPTEYTNNDFLTKHSSAALIPRSHQVDYDDAVFKPGPGTYQPSPDKSTQYSFPRSKSLAAVTSIAPGVGRYQLETLKFSKGSAFAKSSRFGKDGSLGAGVGQYELEVQMQRESKGSMSKSSRFRNAAESTPGPGDYHIQSLIGLKTSLDK